MPLKKSELYASLWKSCDELRGGMDASQYKDYVLVLLFMKYVSDKAASRPDYDLIVPAGGSFADMVGLKGKADIGDGINKVITKLAEANDTLRGAIDVADFNDDDKLGKGKEKVDRLTNLVAIFESPSLDFRGNSAQGDDLLGDAYEYLMRNFATESGKSKGQFYTPAEVSRIMSAVVGVSKATSGTQSIYDPTCGSGSLLLKAHDAAQSATGLDLAIYGQEMDNATAALARMNMVLHDATTAEIAGGTSTLASPEFLDPAGSQIKRFDYVVANPPFSAKSWTTGFDPLHDVYERFKFGQPPAKNGDYAFLLHMVASLKSTGRAAVILPHGVLFRPNSEAGIRRELVRRGLIEGVIGLPANLFYGTGIPACVIVIDKAGADTRRGIFMVDASRGYRKEGAKNRLREQDIHRIVDTFGRQVEETRYSRLVPIEEIERNAFNLNLARYIDAGDAEDPQDIGAHLEGGIPEADVRALEGYRDVFPEVVGSLFGPGDRPGYCRLTVDPQAIRATVFGHDEFGAFAKSLAEVFDEWWRSVEETLASVKIGDKPKELIQSISESVLAAFAHAPLIDRYDVYQRLMDYWAEAFQDDVYLVAQSGWCEAAKPRLLINVKGVERAQPDFTIGKQRFKSDLIPAGILVSRYFPDMRTSLEALESDINVLEAELAEITEEHGVDDGVLADLLDDKGKINRRGLIARLRGLTDDPEATSECAILERLLAVIDGIAAKKATAKTAKEALDRSVSECYGRLTEADIKSLVLHDKWRARLAGDVEGEMARVSQSLVLRVAALSARYASALPALAADTEAAWVLVAADLRSIGAVVE
ncbi:MAG: class I SAM-dependent DNA methyltransferase [Chloroflexota bacterium]